MSCPNTHHPYDPESDAGMDGVQKRYRGTTQPTMSFRWFVKSQGHTVLQQMHYVRGRQEWIDVPTVES